LIGKNLLYHNHKRKKKAVPKSEKRPIPNPRTEEADNHPLEEALVMEAGYPRTFPCSLSPQHLLIRTMTKLSCKISNEKKEFIRLRYSQHNCPL
jgi:hypothetical protein